MDFRYIYTRLNVANFHACKAFYRDIMGLPVKFEDDRDEYVEFDANSIRLTLFNRQNLDNFIPKEESLSFDVHNAQIVLSFQVSNLEEATTHLKNHQVELLAPPTSYPDRGFLSTCFRDPDGNLIEIEQMTDVLIS
ncbi:VOC family protein [Acaryochloris marina]|uniref:Glyoxalase family protein n=1 Tax=Acaryochloris marina (strain MBIC 11017) TaxID=329726 RepID=B0C4U4_ACAM1|nr:VOC family protein [Acaryochloris marina]ABW31082.1 glyoxalase family protein [Acaryochloris marina MBIC11017]BDM79795.1 lactoylglutathione lyase [Acaryochloris marina MBIC10699]